MLIELSVDDGRCDECTENLGKNVAGDLADWETLEDGKTDCDSWVEVTTRGGCRSDDSESDTESIGDGDGEDAAVLWLLTRDVESSLGRDTCVHVKEDTSSFSHHLTKPHWARLFKLKTSARDWWSVNDVLDGVISDDVGDTDFHLAWLATVDVLLNVCLGEFHVGLKDQRQCTGCRL